MDHLTGGRLGWNIVTSWKPTASKAVSGKASTYALADSDTSQGRFAICGA